MWHLSDELSLEFVSSGFKWITFKLFNVLGTWYLLNHNQGLHFDFFFFSEPPNLGGAKASSAPTPYNVVSVNWYRYAMILTSKECRLRPTKNNSKIDAM